MCPYRWIGKDDLAIRRHIMETAALPHDPAGDTPILMRRSHACRVQITAEYRAMFDLTAVDLTHRCADDSPRQERRG